MTRKQQALLERVERVLVKAEDDISWCRTMMGGARAKAISWSPRDFRPRFERPWGTTLHAAQPSGEGHLPTLEALGRLYQWPWGAP